MAVSQSAGHSVAGDRYTITAAAGQYWCEARLEGRNVTSQRSDPVTVSALPKATLTVEPQWSPLYPGENITLKCGVDSPNNWLYLWYKDKNQVSQSAGHSVTGDRYTITAAAESDQGQYRCEARLEGRNVTSQRSDPITLTVSDLSFALGITLGVLGFLIVTALILILFMKYCRKQGLHQVTEQSSEPLYSQVVTNRRSRRDVSQAKSQDNVVYSSLALENKTKMEKKEKNTESVQEAGGHNDVVYSSLALDVKKKKKEKNIQK
ncbi:hypothetical protein MATL_G00235710 [Megalops atlanticus]|uniref:Ig-like domain-containing protein n=1 Tax=Megalops atlanticus TaxID=7932 RepID=A0A9D3SW48_MEGAT|nr:hypothetical protein MATL_G00235710 [Megalops atlanticus]